MKFSNHKYYSGSARITNLESKLDKQARRGKLIPKCYLCGTYDDLKKIHGFYICPDCNTNDYLYDTEIDE